MPKRKRTGQAGRAQKRRKVARAPAGGRALVFPIKRSNFIGAFPASGSTTVTTAYGGNQFKLSDLAGYTELTALFSQYRIKKVSLQCIPRVNQNLNNAAGMYSNFHYAIDYTQASAPTSVQAVMQYDNRRTINCQAVTQFTITLKPQASDVLYNGSVVSGYGAAAPNTWVNTSSPAVNHYGLVWAWDCNYPSATFIDVIATYWLECKRLL